MNWREVLYGGWQPLVRTLVVGVLAYVSLVLVLRISGKRTLSKFNAFDFVVTIALGSTLATVLISQEVSLVQGLVALALLIGLQYVITWLSVRSSHVRKLVKSEPTLLLLRGEPLEGALRRERVTREELLAAGRNQGIASLRDVEAAVLETDGTITFVEKAPDGQPASLAGVDRYPEEALSGHGGSEEHPDPGGGGGRPASTTISS